MRARLSAVAEVALAFAAMHLAFRAFKRFTTWGQWESLTGVNFSPGVAMIAVALVAIALRSGRHAAFRHRIHSYASRLSTCGLTPRPVLPSLYSAILCLLVLGVFGLALTGAGVGIARSKTHWPEAWTVAAASLAATLAILWTLRRAGPDARGGFARGLLALGLVLLIAAPATPIAAALWHHRSMRPEVLMILWLLVGAGIGEEVFFRGYAQSRLNEAFGRPWRLLGVSFGPGLVLASAFFGLVHVLNPTDYFTGTWRFAWPHGLTAFVTLYYGFLRERTGSILAPVAVHFIADMSARWPALMSGSPG